MEQKIKYFGVMAFTLVFIVMNNNANAQNIDIQNTNSNISQPVLVPGPFTGKYESDLAQIPLFSFSPLSKYQIDLKGDNQDSFHKGDTINIAGSITYSLQSNEIQRAQEKCQNNKTTIEIVPENANTNSQKIEYNPTDCNEAFSYALPKIENAGIYVQVWRRDENKEGSLKGDFLIDEFYASKGMELEQGESNNFKFSWKIPTDIKSGKYYFAYFVDSNGRYNLQGLPVVYGDYAKVSDFQIQKDKNESFVEINKDSIRINDKPYISRAPSPTVEPINNQVNIQVPIANGTNSSQNVDIKYEVSGWRQDDSQNIIDTKQEQKTIEAGGNLNYSFAVDTSDASQSLYHVKVTVSTQNSRSAYDLHFVIKNRNRAMLTFLDFAKDKTGNFVPVFCLKNKNWQGYFDGVVKLSLSNENNNQIGSWQKEGNIGAPVACFAVNDAKLTSKNSCLQLKAEISDKTSGKIVDTGNINYCGKNPTENSNPNSVLSQKSTNQGNNNLLISVLIILFIGIMGYLIGKNLINKNNEK